MTVAYVGLGSNLGDRHAMLERALELLAKRVRLLSVSSLRETDPVGLVEQPRFLNAAARVATDLSAPELLDVLLEVERELGRERGRRWAPRTIDLDLLLYGEDRIDDPWLTVPHPRLHERRFVLEPLAELDPALLVPGRGKVRELLAKLD